MSEMNETRSPETATYESYPPKVAVEITRARWMVPTDCHECFIDVQADPQTESKWVEISLLSTHTGWWARGFGRRLREAWGILRGESQWWFDFNSAESLDAFISAASLARAQAFGFQPALPTVGNASDAHIVIPGSNR